MMRSKFIFTYFVMVISMGSGLAACGSEDSGNTVASNGTGQSNGGATPDADAFITQLAALIATSPDDTESTSIDSIAVTTPENSEPVPFT